MCLDWVEQSRTILEGVGVALQKYEYRLRIDIIAGADNNECELCRGGLECPSDQRMHTGYLYDFSAETKRRKVKQDDGGYMVGIFCIIRYRKKCGVSEYMIHEPDETIQMNCNRAPQRKKKSILHASHISLTRTSSALRLFPSPIRISPPHPVPAPLDHIWCDTRPVHSQRATRLVRLKSH